MKTIFIFLLTVTLLESRAQDAVILDRNMQLFTSINNEPVAFASNEYDVFLNKVTGEFHITFPIANLYLAISNTELRVTGENKDKLLTVHGMLPIIDVLDNNRAIYNQSIEVTVNFNDIEHRTFFIFSILRLQPRGFSVMVKGSFPHSVFEINTLKNAKDELGLQMSFTGF